MTGIVKCSEPIHELQMFAMAEELKHSQSRIEALEAAVKEARADYEGALNSVRIAKTLADDTPRLRELEVREQQLQQRIEQLDALTTERELTGEG